MRQANRNRALLACAIAALATATPVPARDGDLDPSFGNGGSMSFPFPGDLGIVVGALVDVNLLDDGRMLVSASVHTGTAAAADMGVMRLHADGALDTSFGDGGARVIGFDRPASDNMDLVNDVIVQPDGRIVLIGTAAGGVGGADMAVVRLHANGAIDTGFGNQGRATVAFDLGATPARREDQAFRGFVQPDGRIVIGGAASTAGGSVMALARLTPSGQLDPSFSNGGRRILDFGGGASDFGVAYRVFPAADGQRIYAVGGASLAGNMDFAAVRLLADGSLDASFGGDGTVTYGFDVGGGHVDIATDAVEMPDGSVLVCGTSQVAAPSNSDFACMRFLANGMPDGSFPPVLVPFDLSARAVDDAIATRLDAQDRVVLAGYAATGNGSFDFAVVRLLPSGQVDPDFGDDGRRTYPGPSALVPYNQAHSIAILPDGRVVLAGTISNSSSGVQLRLVRIVGDTLHEHGFETVPR